MTFFLSFGVASHAWIVKFWINFIFLKTTTEDHSLLKYDAASIGESGNYVIQWTPVKGAKSFFKKFLLLLEMMYTNRNYLQISCTMTKKIDEIIRLFFTNIPGFRTTAYINDIIIVTSIKPKTFLGFWNSGFRWSKCKIRHLRKCTIFNPSPISFHNITSSNWIMVTYNSVTIWIVMYLNSANYIFDEYYVSIHLNIRY